MQPRIYYNMRLTTGRGVAVKICHWANGRHLTYLEIAKISLITIYICSKITLLSVSEVWSPMSM